MWVPGPKPCSVQFLSPVKLAFAMAEGLVIANLQTLETQPMLDSSDPSLEFALQNTVKPMAVFRSLGREFLLCYEGAYYMLPSL